MFSRLATGRRPSLALPRGLRRSERDTKVARTELADFTAQRRQFTKPVELATERFRRQRDPPLFFAPSDVCEMELVASDRFRLCCRNSFFSNEVDNRTPRMILNACNFRR